MLLKDLERQACLDLAEVLPTPAAAQVKIIRQVVVGSPAQEIAKIAAAEKVDLIVIATHGRMGFSRLVMGSVVERVVRTALCPAVTMRPMAVTAEHGYGPVLRRPDSMAG